MTTSSLMCVLFFTRFTAQKLKGAWPSVKCTGSILTVGLPSLVQMGSLSVISVLLNNVLRAAGGTADVTAYAYISRIFALLIVPFTAVSQALSPIVGYNMTEEQKTRIRFVKEHYAFVDGMIAKLDQTISSLPSPFDAAIRFFARFPALTATPQLRSSLRSAPT